MIGSRKLFQTRGKEKLQVTVDAITDYDEDGYSIAGVGYTAVDGEIEAGHSLTLSGATKEFWRREERVKAPGLRVSVTINSSSDRHNFERGIIGGAVFRSDDFLEIELSLDPRCVADIVNELRLNTRRGFRVDGYAINERGFRVAYFLLFRPQS